MTAAIQEPLVCLAESARAKWKAWGAYGATLLEAVEFDSLMQVRQIAGAMTRDCSTRNLVGVQLRIRSLEDKWVKNALTQAEFADGRELMKIVREGAANWLPQREISAVRPDKVTSINGVSRKRPAGPPVEAAASKNAHPVSEGRPERALVRIFRESNEVDFVPSKLHVTRAGANDPTMLWSKI
ncbi:hypothetical protein CYMTET_31526 [Cymbomonas tetramitiformis]|uniref:Uncharacterized protein n=1 Tax=Cymbomonas tetramitiformis TaxID=36881 RepID=A0AAE0KSV7_9CHLO|nr:hypothetical protein CYMTET_31526 [Cymbomonas tetramitiformis]